MRYGKSDFDSELGWFRDDFETEFDKYWWLDSKQPPDDIDSDAWRSMHEVRDLADSVAGIGKSLLRRKGLGAERLQGGAQLAEEAKLMEQNVAKVLNIAASMESLSADDRAKIASALESPGGIGDPRAKQLIFATRLQQNAHDYFNRSPAQMANRLQTLVRYLVRFPGDRAYSYLARVAECFVLGLRAEFAIMTRSVLDTAIEDLVPDEVIRPALRLRQDQRIGLANRIKYCEDHNHGPILAASAEGAKRIKQAGDDAAHVVAGLERDPEALLEDLAACLSELERHRPDKKQ